MKLKELIKKLESLEDMGEEEVGIGGDGEGYWGLDRVEVHTDTEGNRYINLASDNII